MGNGARVVFVVSYYCSKPSCKHRTGNVHSCRPLQVNGEFTTHVCAPFVKQNPSVHHGIRLLACRPPLPTRHSQCVLDLCSPALHHPPRSSPSSHSSWPNTNKITTRLSPCLLRPLLCQSESTSSWHPDRVPTSATCGALHRIVASLSRSGKYWKRRTSLGHQVEPPWHWHCSIMMMNAAIMMPSCCVCVPSSSRVRSLLC